MIEYVITTESGVDLSPAMIERYGIHVIPMHVTMGDQSYPDGSFDVRKVFDFYDETGNLPKTSGSTPQDCSKVFDEILINNPEAHIIHIGYSSVTTVSFNAAKIAAEDRPNIHLVDSKHVTIGAAAIVKATAEFIEENPSVMPDEIIAFVEDIRERTHMYFLPKTLRYLKAGGRVSSAAFFSANLLRIQPTIVLENGYLVPGKKYRGSFDRCLKRMIGDFFKDFAIDPETVLVVGAPIVSEQHRKLIRETMTDLEVEQEPNWMKTGAVIASHGGPGAIGIAGIETSV